MNPIARTGQATIERLRRLCFYSGVVLAVARRAVRPSSWKAPVRDVLARQILFTGFEAVPFIALLAFAAGVVVVLQAQLWLSRLGQSAAIGPLLTAIIVREAGPLLTNMIVIGRSGTAMSSELAGMQVTGEVSVLESQGIDPVHYLLMPRLLGMSVSVFCLCIVFIAVSLVSGYALSMLLNPQPPPPDLFFSQVLGALRPVDVMNVLVKTLVVGLYTGALCCVNGLRVRHSLTEIPQAVTKSLVGSMLALFLISLLVSLVSYV